jgi:glycosyltransferase involved in cell wall biosynthesis
MIQKINEFRPMRIAQVAPLTEAIPPKLYGGTERVVHWLTEELVALGNDVTLFASGDSRTTARLEATWPKALRLDGSIRDPNALHIVMLERVRQLSHEFDLLHFHLDYYPFSLFARQQTHSSPPCMAGLICRSTSRYFGHFAQRRSFQSQTHNGGRSRRPIGSRRSITGFPRNY